MFGFVKCHTHAHTHTHSLISYNSSECNTTIAKMVSFVKFYSPERKLIITIMTAPNGLRHQYSYASASLNASLYVYDIFENRYRTCVGVALNC